MTAQLDDQALPDELVDQEPEQNDSLTIADLNDIVLYTVDWSVQSILERIGDTFDVNPSFQRRDAWTQQKKSAYIESLILGLPVPQVVLAEDPTRRGRFIVLDGKQRLVTLKQFAASNEHFPPFKLRGLQFADQLEGMSYQDMQQSLTAQDEVDNLLSQPVRTVVVRNWGRPEVLYEVFIRLNQNSLPLSPQELRQALFPSDFTRWVNDRSAKSSPLHDARRAKREDFRMRDAEMLLRFLAWKEQLPDYRGNLRQFLDDQCRIGIRNWERYGPAYYEELAAKCETGIARTFDVFGDDAFLRFENGSYNRRFNIAVFDLMTVVFSDERISAEQVVARAPELKAAFERLCTEDEAFTRSITATTKSVSSVRERFLTWVKATEEILDESLSVRGAVEALLTPGSL